MNEKVKDKDNLSEFLRLLEISGWSQAQAAKELGLTTGAVSQYVNRITQPKATVVRLFKLLLGVREEFGPVEWAQAKLDRPLLPLQSWEHDIIRDLRKLDKQTKQHVIHGFRLILRAVPKARR